MKALRLAVGIAIAAQGVGFIGEPTALAKTETSKKAAKESLPAFPEATADTSAPPKLISTTIGGRDLQFLMSAMENGRVQSWLGEQSKRAESEQLRAIGDAIQSTQEEENRHLQELAAKNGVNMSGDGSSAMQRKLSQQLAPLKGPKFDKALIDRFVEATQNAVSAYETGLQSKDERIRHFAEQMLPVAKEKRQLVAKLAGTATDASEKPSFRSGTAPAAEPR
jgi:predicted outer membrane protein